MIIQLIENIDIFDRVIFNRFIYLLTSLMHYFWTKEENFWEKGLFQGTSEWWEPRGRLNHIPRGIGEWQKLPGPQGTGSSVFPVASLIMTHLVLIKMDEKLFSLGVIFLLLRIFFEHFLQTIRNASLVKFVTPFLIHKKFILKLDISFLSFQ